MDEIDQVALLKARALYTLQAAATFSPRLVHPEQTTDFSKEVIEETTLG